MARSSGLPLGRISPAENRRWLPGAVTPNNETDSPGAGAEPSAEGAPTNSAKRTSARLKPGVFMLVMLFATMLSARSWACSPVAPISKTPFMSLLPEQIERAAHQIVIGRHQPLAGFGAAHRFHHRHHF